MSSSKNGCLEAAEYAEEPAHEVSHASDHKGSQKPGHEESQKPGHEESQKPGHEESQKPGHEESQKPGHEESHASTHSVGKKPGSVTVGSRRSELALCQTYHVLSHLAPSGRDFNIVHMDTIGDQILDRALSLIGDKGLFTRELDAALLSGEVHFVVHSLKDLPTVCPDGLTVPCILRREMPCDALVLHPRHAESGVRDLAGLPAGSLLGTSSLRRAAQLARSHPSLRFESVRGNLGTRWRKLLAEGTGLDGLILAEAGLVRLGWQSRITCRLDSGDCLPAVGQGALAVQCRAGDWETIGLLKPLVHRDTFLEVAAERSLLRALDGGCSVPLGVRASWEAAEGDSGGRTLRLEARVLSIDGSEVVEFSAGVRLSGEAAAAPEAGGPPEAKRARRHGCEPQPESAVGLMYPHPDELDLSHLADCVRLGRLVADGLLERGAGPVLDAAKAAAKAAIGKPLPQQQQQQGSSGFEALEQQAN